MELLDYQADALKFINDKNKVMLALDMGLGKTFTGLKWLDQKPVRNTLIICQSNKINDWAEEAKRTLTAGRYRIVVIKTLLEFINEYKLKSVYDYNTIFIISYMIFVNMAKQKKMWYWSKGSFWNCIIDESQILKNPKSKISKYVMKFRTATECILLLSGDPISNEYKDLFVQMKVLGLFEEHFKYWDFQNRYCNTIILKGTSISIIVSYKNVDELIETLKTRAFFLSSAEATKLPKQIFETINVPNCKEYKTIKLDRVLSSPRHTFVADTSLKLMLYLRELSSGFLYREIKEADNYYQFNYFKIAELSKLVNRLKNKNIVVFYNFRAEYNEMMKMFVRTGKTILTINGDTNDWLGDTTTMKHNDTVILIHFQSGARGIDKLQHSFNHLIYYSLPLSGELYKQSLKRIHRLNQPKDCYYYTLLTEASIDDQILSRLEKSQNYTLRIFENKKH